MAIVDTQLKHNDCGISAIKTICNLYKIDISRRYIEESVFTDAEGSRLSDIKSFLDNNRFDTKYRLLDFNNLVDSNESYYKELFPFILPVSRRAGIHFVIIDKIKNKKFRVLDPEEKKSYYLTASALKREAYFNNNYVDYISIKEKAGVICNQVLVQYGFDVTKVNTDISFDTLFNKITYFLYIKEEYGLSSEKKALTDILYNQNLSKLPEHFQTFRYDNERLKIKAPVVLSVKPIYPTFIDEYLGILDKEKDSAQSKKEENIYITLFKELGKSKRIWYLYIFIALFSASLTQLAVFINQILIDDVLAKKNLSIVVLFAVGIAIFMVFDLFISLYKSWIGITLGRILDEHFLKNFNDKLNRFSLSYIQGYKRGDLTERLSDSMKLKAFFLQSFTRLLVDSSVSIYTLAILLYINWQLTIVVIVVMILFYIWFRIITPFLQQNERTRFIKKADFFSRMIERLEGVQVLKSTHIEQLYSGKIHRSINELLTIQIKTYKINMLNGMVASLITIAASVFIITYLSEKSITEGLITIGQIITFITLSHRIFSSLGSILDENLSLQENQVILKRFLDFKEAKTPEPVNGIRQFSLDSIQMKNVTYGYHPMELVLTDVSIDIEKGDKIKIEGRNGSGKSTLSKVLSLLYEPTHGQINVNSIGSMFYDRNKLREKILLISNEDILFNDTFLYNLTFGKDISVKKVLKLAKELQLYDFISSKAQGLEFMISENGKNLSTGQRKKILLLRALLHDAELIILDEVLSGIDLQSREEIEACLNKENDKTFIIISHEPISLLKFNKTYIIDEGVLSYKQTV